MVRPDLKSDIPLSLFSLPYLFFKVKVVLTGKRDVSESHDPFLVILQLNSTLADHRSTYVNASPRYVNQASRLARFLFM